MPISAAKDAPARPQSGQPLEESLHELMENARLLARHAVEIGQLPRSVDVERMFAVRRRFELMGEISESDLSFFVRSYQHLERKLGPVSVDTLRATEWKEGKPCEAGRYVHRLWWRTYLNIAVILACHLFLHLTDQKTFTGPEKDWIKALTFIAHYSIPFLYGALGADAFLIRETTHKLHVRQFDPRRIPENAARFLLGTLSGGVVVLFVNPKIVETAMGKDVVQWAMGSAALGFLAGYSNDFLFTTLERIINAVTAREASEDIARLSRVDHAAEDLLERFEDAVERVVDGPKKKDSVAWSRPPRAPQVSAPVTEAPLDPGLENLKSLTRG